MNHVLLRPCAVCSSDLLAVFPRRYLPVIGHADQLIWRELPLEMPLIEIGLLWHRRHERDAAQRWPRETLARIVPAD